MTALPQLHATDEPARPRTSTLGYRFPPAVPMAPPAHDCDREQLLDVAAGAARGGDDLWSLIGSRDHVQAICRLLVEHIEPDLVDATLRATRLEAALHGARAAHAGAEAELAALAARLESNRNAARVLVAQRDRLALTAGAIKAENAWLRSELAAALEPKITAQFERLTVTVTGESYAVVAERLTASVRDVDARFDYIDVAGSDETIDGIDQSTPVPADEVPLVEQRDEPKADGPTDSEPTIDVDDQDQTLDMEPGEVGGEGGGA